MVVQVDPFLIPIPKSLLQDKETRTYFEYQNRFLHDLWQRTGGGTDTVDDNQLSEVFENGVSSSIAVSDAADRARNIVSVSANYTVLIDDYTVEVNATSGSITITLPAISEILGYKFNIKRVDSILHANKVTIIGNGSELIDNHENGVDLYLLSNYGLIANSTGWSII